MFSNPFEKVVATSIAFLIIAQFSVVAAPPAVHRHPLGHPEVNAPVDSSAWESLDEGLHVSFASKDKHYPHHEVPFITPSLRWSATAWRGQRVNAQLVFWAKQAVQQVRCSITGLKSQTGHTIPSSAIRLRPVGYVLSNLPSGSDQSDCEHIDQSAVHLVPDVLEHVGSFHIDANTSQPVWMTIDVPRDTPAGVYTGTLSVTAVGEAAIPLSVTINVQAATLPKVADWKVRLDLWQNPWAVAHFHGVRPWSKSHLELLRPHLKMLAEAGQKFVTTYVCHSPWGDVTHVADETMVEWIRHADGSFSFDYTIFDTYVALAQQCGITDAITCYTVQPWGHRIRYLDEETGNYVWNRWPPDSQEFEEFWAQFLENLRGHLKQQRWFDKTYLGVNERKMEETIQAVKTIRRDSPDWKISFSGNWHEQLDLPSDDYSAAFGKLMNREQIQNRRERGATTTFYVSCDPPRPNTFTFSPPAESTWMGWYAAANGLDGFVRWAYDSWTAEPLRDTRHVQWPAGDCFLVYPDARSSIRFERLREGLVDYEKVRLLREQLSKQGGDEAAIALARLDKMLTRFTRERATTEPVAPDVNAASALLDDLTPIAFGTESR